MTQQLAEFFRQKKERADAENAGVDWDQKKREWLTALDSLYGQVTLLLQDPVSQGTLQLSRRQTSINEEHLGSYDADELVLSVGDEKVIFAPKGRNIVGASGRVDVRGESGEAMLVLQPGPRWSVVKSKYPQLRMIPLNEESFAELLQGVMRP